jgi:hypothetical protein
MTRDDMLNLYEDVWRQCAMEGRSQFYAGDVIAGPNFGGCAYMALFMMRSISRSSELPMFSVHWTCPECKETAWYIAGVMIHLNNVHRWTWDMLAGKFRDTLARGEAAASGASTS